MMSLKEIGRIIFMWSLADNNGNDQFDKNQRLNQIKFVKLNKLLNHCPHAISPRFLRDVRYIHINQYLDFQVERLGHVLSLTNSSPLNLPFPKQELEFEGMHESYALPMIVSSVKDFLARQSKIDQSVYQWALEELNKMTISHVITDQEIRSLFDRVKQSDFKGPICIGGGHADHFVFNIFIGDLLIDGNRGDGCGDEPGICIYRIDRQALSLLTFYRLCRSATNNRSNWMTRSRLMQQLNGALIHHQKMSDSKTGICAYAGIKAGWYALTALGFLIEAFKDEFFLLNKVSSPVWKTVFEQMRPMYKAWSAFDCRLVVYEFLKDVKEATRLKSKSKDSKKLIEFYKQVMQEVVDQSGGRKKLRKAEQVAISKVWLELNQATNVLNAKSL